MNAPRAMPPLSALQEFYAIDVESPSGLTRIKRTQGPNGALGPVCSVGTDDYWRMKFQGVPYRTNRIVYYMHTGTDPGPLVVDHIDGNHRNNIPENLRACTHQENLWNAAGRPKQSGLPKGIAKLATGLYEIRLSISGEQHIQILDNFKAAVQYLKSLRDRHHGEYARA